MEIHSPIPTLVMGEVAYVCDLINGTTTHLLCLYYGTMYHNTDDYDWGICLYFLYETGVMVCMCMYTYLSAVGQQHKNSGTSCLSKLVANQVVLYFNEKYLYSPQVFEKTTNKILCL